MGQGGVDLEEPYHTISDEEAPPFLGEAAPPSPAGHRKELRRQIICYSVLCLVVAAIWLGRHFYEAMVYANIPSFTVHLTSYDGIDAARPARVVSPAFNLTIRINKTCADRADVVVSYADVALSWGRVEPHDCTGERPGRDVAVMAQGKGVGLSRGLRQRMAEERRGSAALELDVEVTVYNDVPDHIFGPDVRDNVMSCMLRTDGHGRSAESEPCTWYSLVPFDEKMDIFSRQ
ncbi:unnamed protein product [Triticum turgidum subsp. durum]|uniref:Late embryogenesis abundant protein LEA-2 subgroup domain-containing protein n=1 Tax=Triticum turgidum subsp. durum TaxID=4567 RepID=A0A9R1NH94_TRITD|nr:unnamed protein product [Triticum turgidum subsp. durum]